MPDVVIVPVPECARAALASMLVNWARVARGAELHELAERVLARAHFAQTAQPLAIATFAAVLRAVAANSERHHPSSLRTRINLGCALVMSRLADELGAGPLGGVRS